jgi:hypothetical protein
MQIARHRDSVFPFAQFRSEWRGREWRIDQQNARFLTGVIMSALRRKNFLSRCQPIHGDFVV